MCNLYPRVIHAVAVGALLLGGAALADHTTPFVGARSEAGAFTCDFALPLDMPMETLAPTIERDRIYMGSRPGQKQKHIPVRFAPEGILAGGRYLFDTAEQAEEYLAWVRDEYTLDGEHFLERPYFINPQCFAWQVIGAHDFADIHTSQMVLRTERWALWGPQVRQRLAQRWPALRHEAALRGYSSVWLLYEPRARLASVVYFTPRGLPAPLLDLTGLLALELAAPLGAPLATEGWQQVFDRTSWTLTIWAPTLPGDSGAPSLWPYSPPFPAPACGDGVCTPSRGEDGASCAADCPADCGDALCQPGEDSRNCPGDCPF